MAKTVYRAFKHIGYIFLMLHFACSQVPTSTEVHNAEVRLRTDLLKNYSVDVMPRASRKSSAVIIAVTFQIVFIKDLDAKTQTLSTEGWLKMKWNDSRLAWNPEDYAGIDVIRLAPHKIWRPDIELYNSAKGIKLGQKSKVFTLLHSSGKVLWVPPVSYHSICSMDLKNYPYDKHSCNLRFGSWIHDGLELDVQLYDQKTHMDLSEAWDKSGEWKISEARATRNVVYYDCCPEPFMDVIFQIKLQRRSPFYKASIICPLVGAVIFLLASFWLPPTANYRITLIIVSFLTTTVLLMHLSRTLQNTGRGCPLIVTFCGILLQVSTLTIAISVAFSEIAYSKRNDPIPEWLRKLLQTPLLSYFCIRTSKQDLVLGNKTEFVTNMSSDDEQMTSNNTVGPPSTQNLWVSFFQVMDRILFVTCLIVLISITIVLST